MIMGNENINNNPVQVNNETEPTLFDFVKSLFAGHGKTLANGDFCIEMADGSYLVVHLYEDKDKKTVEVYINRKLMGVFNEYKEKGYKCEFQQRYRVGIRNGRTVPEQYMENTCTFHRDLIRLNKAYHS